VTLPDTCLDNPLPETLPMATRSPLVAAGLLFACIAAAADWPSFRGPNRDGVSTETGLLQVWPKDGPAKLWTAKNLGLGFGAPTVAGGKIFGMGTRDGKDGVWALKESDGIEIWFTPIADPRRVSQNNGPSGSPTIADEKLYATTSTGKLVCLATDDGKKIWEADYVKDFGGRQGNWGFTESPLVDGAKVIVTPGSASATMVALEKDTGKVIWKTETKTGSGGAGGYSSPVKATVGDVPMYIVLLGTSGGLIGVHADTGNLLWQYTAAALGGTAQIPTPIVKGDLVWFSTSYRGGSALLQLVPDGKDKVTVKELRTYRQELMNHHGGMVLVGDHIYSGNGHGQGQPVCVELKTGEIAWGPAKYPAGGSGSAAVLYADNRLYFRYQNGVMVLIEPSPEELKVVSSFKLPSPDVKSNPQGWAHPVVANGKLYIRDQNVMYCYDVRADKN
jgi:outer membrane protein assembly factor BamB